MYARPFLTERAEQFRVVGKEKIDQYVNGIVDLIKNASKDGEGILEMGGMEIKFEFNIADKDAKILTLWSSVPIVYGAKGEHKS